MKHQKLHKIAPINELLKSGVQGVKLELLIKDYICVLKTPQTAVIIHLIDKINQEKAA